jgi:1,2-phenylacetyl-CoA epoxidase PaaB subunit
MWTVRKQRIKSLKASDHRNILHEIRKQRAKRIGHILRRNCHLQRVIEGKIQGGIEVTGRRGRRRRKILDNPKERKV